MPSSGQLTKQALKAAINVESVLVKARKDLQDVATFVGSIRDATLQTSLPLGAYSFDDPTTIDLFGQALAVARGHKVSTLREVLRELQDLPLPEEIDLQTWSEDDLRELKAFCLTLHGLMLETHSADPEVPDGMRCASNFNVRFQHSRQHAT